MSNQNSIVRGLERSTWRVASLALGAALLMGPSARADSDFENAFEASLGYFLAFEAVQAAKSVLYYGAPVAVAAPYVAPSYYPAPAVVVGYGGYSRPRAHYHEHRHHYKAPKHHYKAHKHHVRHPQHDRGWDRGRGHGYRDRDDRRGRDHGRKDHGKPRRGHGRDGGRGDGGRYAHR